MLLFAKAAAGGIDSNTVHLIVLDDTTSINNNLLYYRSSDFGNTWDIAGEPLSGINSTKYGKIFPESYCYTCRQIELMLYDQAAYCHTGV